MKIRPTHPLISCICITSKRTEMLLRAIFHFEAQGYPNRELIVSYSENDLPTKMIVSKLTKSTTIRIIALERSDSMTIGQAKNMAIKKCNGDYICNWDDDDWYQSSRLSYQLNNMLHKGKFCKASIITNILLYDSVLKNAYLSLSDFWIGTLFCKKEVLLNCPYQDYNFNEGEQLIETLKADHLLHQIGDAPYLYIYAYHGQNALEYSNFSDKTKQSQLLDQESTEWIHNLLHKDIKLLFPSDSKLLAQDDLL